MPDMVGIGGIGPVPARLGPGGIEVPPTLGEGDLQAILQTSGGKRTFAPDVRAA
jgi:hypothetical protein